VANVDVEVFINRDGIGRTPINSCNMQRLDEAMNKFNQGIAQSNTECTAVVVCFVNSPIVNFTV
jgi:hypothetical protein